MAGKKDNIRVRIEGVSKRFRKATLRKNSYTTVKTSFLQRFFSRAQAKANILTALDTITISVPAGRSLGVIGRNGSGKSTLLKLIAGIYRPDTGSISVNGRISALIELGAGFHPDFTGRENVYLGGVMYGLTRTEIDERFDDIVRYAELEDFIDDPVRTYSSGMYMRLGFSLAIHTDPDILLVDEVLAVGDAAFIHRCHDTISEFRRKGKTLIFVTHDLNSVVRWCDEAIWLHQGLVQKRGEPRKVIDSYLSAIEEKESAELEAANTANVEEKEAEELPGENTEDAGRWGSKDVEIQDVRMLNEKGEPKWLFHDDEPIVVEVRYAIKKPVEELVFGIGILRADGLAVHGTNTDIEEVKVPIPTYQQANGSWQGMYRYRVPRLPLIEDSYFLDVAAHRKDGTPFDYHHRLYKFSMRGSAAYHGVFHPEHDWEFEAGYDAREDTD